MSNERVQKVLANAGYGSRREIEKWIVSGRIMVNGVKAVLGDRMGDKDVVKIDGRIIKFGHDTEARNTIRVIALNKAEGTISTRQDPENRPTVFEKLPRLKQQRWVTVGRLDINTSGLLLLTTDGELANRLMHPSFEIEREYLVRVMGEVTPEMIRQLTRGVDVDGCHMKFGTVEVYRNQVASRITNSGIGLYSSGKANQWYKVTLAEGKNREVRRLWEHCGLRVSRLIRTRYGPIILGKKLKAGEVRELDKHEISLLHELTAEAKPRPAAD